MTDHSDSTNDQPVGDFENKDWANLERVSGEDTRLILGALQNRVVTVRELASDMQVSYYWLVRRVRYLLENGLVRKWPHAIGDNRQFFFNAKLKLDEVLAPMIPLRIKVRTGKIQVSGLTLDRLFAATAEEGVLDTIRRTIRGVLAYPFAVGAAGPDEVRRVVGNKHPAVPSDLALPHTGYARRDLQECVRTLRVLVKALETLAGRQEYWQWGKEVQLLWDGFEEMEDEDTATIASIGVMWAYETMLESVEGESEETS